MNKAFSPISVIKLTNKPSDEWDQAYMWITSGEHGDALLDYCPLQGWKREGDIYQEYFANEADAHSRAFDKGFTVGVPTCSSEEIVTEIAELKKNPYPPGYSHPQQKGHSSSPEPYEK